MVKRFRRMTESDVRAIVADLDRWAVGQLGSKLTWALLEERFGFSRQSLDANHKIKAAFIYAKQALAGGLVQTREQAAQENSALQRELEKLKFQIAESERREYLWKQRWQRIAYHIREKGIQMDAVDRPVGLGANLPNERETATILRPFDKEIPPSGRV